MNRNKMIEMLPTVRLIDEKYHHIYTLAERIGLPGAVAITLCDKSFPAESFGTFTAEEWSMVLQGTEIDPHLVFSRIAAWKLAAKIGPSQSCIPTLQPNFYMLQIFDPEALPEQTSSTDDYKPEEQKEHCALKNVVGNGGVGVTNEDVQQPDSNAGAMATEEKKEDYYDSTSTTGVGISSGEKNEELSTAEVDSIQYSKPRCYRATKKQSGEATIAMASTDADGQVGRRSGYCGNTDDISVPELSECEAECSHHVRTAQLGQLAQQNQENDHHSVLRTRNGHQLVVENHPFFTPNDLTNLLSQSDVGQAIIRNSFKGALSKDSKRELASCIANHHISAHSQGTDSSMCRLPKAVLENYVNCIRLRFPAEENDMITYYIPATPPERRNPGGSIYQAYKRLKYQKRDREKRELHHAAKLMEKENYRNGKKLRAEDSEQSEAFRWLALNNTPWETVLNMWRLTEPCRLDGIKSMKTGEILTTYHHYLEPLGYQLIDKDYHSLGFSEGIQKWNEVIGKLKPYFILKVRDQYSTAVLEHMSHVGVTEDTLVCCILILLNCCVKPCKVTKTVKPAILTAQEDVLVFAQDLKSAVETIRELFASYAKNGIAPHPKIVVIGSDYKTIKGEFYVVFEEVQYKIFSAARAVDIVIKMCNVLNLPFSKVTKLVWFTIEEVLYDIRAPAQYKEIETIKKLL